VLGEGPGPTAYETNTITVSDPRVDAGRWPLFTDAASNVPGVNLIYAVPIRSHDHVIGVLTVHQDIPDLPDPDQAQFLADAIGAALTKDVPAQEAELDTGPWSTRSEIHQATGMVLAQLRIGPDDAMALLRAHAFSHNLTLAEVAEQITHRRLRFTDDAESETS
jgi:ANTAR domain